MAASTILPPQPNEQLKITLVVPIPAIPKSEQLSIVPEPSTIINYKHPLAELLSKEYPHTIDLNPLIQFAADKLNLKNPIFVILVHNGYFMKTPKLPFNEYHANKNGCVIWVLNALTVLADQDIPKCYSKQPEAINDLMMSIPNIDEMPALKQYVSEALNDETKRNDLFKLIRMEKSRQRQQKLLFENIEQYKIPLRSKEQQQPQQTFYTEEDFEVDSQPPSATQQTMSNTAKALATLGVAAVLGGGIGATVLFTRLAQKRKQEREREHER